VSYSGQLATGLASWRAFSRSICAGDRYYFAISSDSCPWILYSANTAQPTLPQVQTPAGG